MACELDEVNVELGIGLDMPALPDTGSQPRSLLLNNTTLSEGPFTASYTRHSTVLEGDIEYRETWNNDIWDSASASSHTWDTFESNLVVPTETRGPGHSASPPMDGLNESVPSNESIDGSDRRVDAGCPSGKVAISRVRRVTRLSRPRYNCNMPNCPVSFTRLSDLRRHIDHKHGQSPTLYKCGKCDFSKRGRADKVAEHCEKLNHGKPKKIITLQAL